MHFNLKRTASLFLAGAMTLSAASGNKAFPELDTIAAENNGYTDKEISSAVTQPELSVSRIELTYKEAKDDPVQTVSIYVKGASGKYSVTGIHVYWDSRLTPQKNESGYYASGGSAVESLLQEYYNLENGFFATTSAVSDEGKDGVMYTFDLRLPDDIKGGEVYDISIQYEENELCGDLFTDSDDSEAGRLMQAWVFTRGINNGYIKVGESQNTTTTTTTTATSTTTTTSTTTSASTTTKNTSASTTTTTSSTTTTPPPIQMYGDVDDDNKITAYDAALTLTEYAALSAGKATFNATQTKIADVDDDGKITANDAANILSFYSYLSGNGTEKDIKKWIKSLG